MTESGFDSGLFDPADAGVHYLAAGDVAGVEMVARDEGLQVDRIDLHGCDGKRVLMIRIAFALGLPEGFGHNWDALWDVLVDRQWLRAPDRGRVLVFEGAADLRDAAHADFEALLDLLQEATAFWAEAGPPMWVLMCLPDEEIDALEEAEGQPHLH